jgi:hypothetical protein
MSEIRKPCFIFLLREPGNPIKKVELFPESLWVPGIVARAKRYRLRINGKWWPNEEARKKNGWGKMKFFTKWDFRDLLWRSINL